ncbi:MAG TPA: hypothetical protein VK061_00990 [Bacillota bacterium]|nr:hypothetical protein [Bacillota bacterium]
MKHFNKDKRIINNYKEQEKMMILIYAQWCVNHGIDPIELYHEAYPEQQTNDVLEEAVRRTVSKEESDSISDDVLLQALQTFGNHDLAFVVQQKTNELEESKIEQD